jgi:hypothetical protein
MTEHGQEAADKRKTYYVALGAGQILEDREAAPFEYEIRANEEELNKLQELFEELASADEATASHMMSAVLVSASDEDMNADYDHQFQKVYQLIYELGTEKTKRHIESIGVVH